MSEYAKDKLANNARKLTRNLYSIIQVPFKVFIQNVLFFCP